MVAAILGILWVWNGLAYHLAFFAHINPAAYGFAALFVLTGRAVLRLRHCCGRLRFAGQIGWSGMLGMVLIAYAGVIYTAMGY